MFQPSSNYHSENDQFLYSGDQLIFCSAGLAKKMKWTSKEEFQFCFFLHLVVKCQLLILLTEVVAVNWSSPDAVEIKASSVPAFVKSFQN